MRIAMLLAAALLGACGEKPKPALAATTVLLPSGTPIEAQLLTDPQDMARGMMFREQLPAGQGLLFVHPEGGRHGYWMHNVKVPLDILWIDRDRRVVEISAGTPPCLKPAAECPSYGGNAEAHYVLEIAGGEAARLGIRLGDQLRF